MTFRQKYHDLKEQEKSIRRDMKQRRNAITREVLGEVTDENSICIQKMDVLGIGCKCDFMKIEVTHCEMFEDTKYCTNQNCPMLSKNNSYINYVKIYKDIKKAERNLIKSIFIRSK